MVPSHLKLFRDSVVYHFGRFLFCFIFLQAILWDVKWKALKLVLKKED